LHGGPKGTELDSRREKLKLGKIVTNPMRVSYGRGKGSLVGGK